MLAREFVSTPPRETLERRLWQLDTPLGLVAMFSLALVVRMAIAPYVGFYGDLHLFQTWAERLAAVGTHHFYTPGRFADYPPGYLYVLWLTGKVSSTPGYVLLKLPAIAGDLALAWIAGVFAERLAPQSTRERRPVRALVAAAVLFNPAVIALSAGWGQVDSVPAALVLGSLLLLFTGPASLRRELAAFLLFAVAISMKPQSGFVVPVMLYALYRRYLDGKSRSELLDGVLGIALIGAASLGLWLVSGLAFGLRPVGLLRFYEQSSSVYPVTSANAFNLWGALGFWRGDSTGDHVMRIAGVPALQVGMLLFAIAVGLVLWRLHRALRRGAHEARAMTLAAAVVALLAYVLLTRMHERYMFASLACLAPLVFVRPLRLAYAGLSALFLLDLWYPFAYFNSQWKTQVAGVHDFVVQPWFDALLGGLATDTWQKRVWSLAVVGIAAAVSWSGMRWVEASAPAALDPLVRDPRSAPARARPRVTWTLPRASRPEQPRSDSRWWPLGLVGLSCVFGLVVLRGETRPALNLNDSAFHLQMVRWAGRQIHEGRVPLDGWYPFLSLGSSFFHHYQSLAEILTAYLARVTGAGAQTTYLWLLYLLLAFWPIAVYAGARLLEWDRWTAAPAAAVAPLIVSAPGYGYEHGSYTWQGYGVYSQLWAMWLLPIAWGLTWRAVARGRLYAAAAVALALTIACHFITGYLAILTVGVWVIVLAGSGFVRRVGRAALVVGGGMLVAAWVLVPLVGDTKWTTRSEYYQGTIFNDSYGARKVLGWLVTGKLFDSGRFPIVSLLVLAGVVVCLARVRRDARGRALLGAFALSLLLFFGRPTLGAVLKALPGFGDVQIHRFVMGVDLAAILLAGVGLAWLLRTASQLVYRVAEGRLPPARYALVAAAAFVLVCVGVLAPAWIDRGRLDRNGAVLMSSQRAAEATDGRSLDRLVAIVRARGGGRVYAGLRSNWGHDYVVGYVPVYAWLADRDVDAIGFTFRTIASLSTDPEAAFDETNPAQYQMYDVRYLILPSDHLPPVPAKLLASSGRHRLYEVATSGYFQVVDRAAPVSANRTNLEAATRGWRQSDLASRAIYPGVAFAGGAAPPPTFAGAAPPAGSPGGVLTQHARLQDGIFAATVRANRDAVVLLKATYDPRWRVTVDGRPARTSMMAPSLVGVEVPGGRHTVRFEYEPYPHYRLLVGVGALALLALVLAPGLGRMPRAPIL
jgi:Gpi18-like mannosyltransferase